MALNPATVPVDTKAALGPTIQEVIDDGALDVWYIIRAYDLWPTARDSAVKLRKRYPGLDIRAQRGTVYARKVS